jgi:hypothetical protein
MADPLQTLRHHVTGAIERGEAIAIEGKPMTDKSTIIAALYKWIAQRPGLEFGNYGDMSSYRSEMRSITRDLHHARAMINYAAWHDSITAEMILDAADNGGRLTLTADGDKVTIDYVTGQYWSTEYRRAVCSLMATVIWAWLRSNLGDGCTGDDIRKAARREMGASIARRWFR